MNYAKIAALLAASAALALSATKVSATEGSPRLVVAQAAVKASGEGVVKGVEPKERKLLVTHGPIPALKWSAMTMPFGVTPDFDISTLKPGSKIKFNVTRDPNGLYILEDIRPAD